MFDFPLTVESIDAVPPEFQSLYEDKGDEGIHLNEALAKKVSDTGNLHKSLQAERKTRANLERELKGFKSIGESPDAITQMIEGYRSIADTPEALQELLAQKDKLLEGKDTEKVVQQVRDAAARELTKAQEQFKTQLAEKDGRITLVSAAMEREMIDSAATAEIVKQKGIPELLLPVVRRQIKVVEEDGRFVRRIVDDEGDTKVNGKGEPMTIADLVTEMRNNDLYARAFDGEGRGGSGAPASPGGGGNRVTKTYTLAEWQKVTGEASPEDRKKLLAQKAAGTIKVKT